MARFTRRPRTLVADAPVPLGAALVAFVVMQFGVPGQEKLAAPKGW